MIKKITLTSVAAFALLMLPAQVQASSCNSGVAHGGKDHKEHKMHKEHKSEKGHHKMHKRGHGSPLLMHLPSPMKMLMKMENDPKLALSAEQKTKLEAQRNEKMPKMMKLKEDIKATSKEIKEACKKSVPAAEQKANVEKLAVLKTEATMLKLTCIEGVKAILSKEQQAIMKEMKKAKMAKMKAMREKAKGMKMEAMKDMKCQAGKCGSK